MNISNNIRYYRELSRMKQSELGGICGVSSQAVSKWELGKAQPSCDDIEIMCGLWHISADTLLGLPHKEFAGLSPAEKQIIIDFRKLSLDDKKYIIKTMSMLRLADDQNQALSDMGIA